MLIFFIAGAQNLAIFFKWLFGIVFGLGILFLLAYIFWLVFLAPRNVDLPANYRKKLIRTSKLMKNAALGNLYLSGDEKHNRIKLGKYSYLRIVLPKQQIEIIEEVPQEEAHLRKPKTQEMTEPIPVDCFVILKTNIWDMLFGEPIFILCKPSDHNYSSIFNDVVISGFNLVPLDSQFYTIDRRNLDVDIIRGISAQYLREVLYSIFRDLDRITKSAMALDSRFQKDKQKSSEFEIPRMDMGGEKR